MRQHRMLGEVPVIMVTGTATREAVLKGLQGGANGYITKPFQIDVLVKAVKTVLGIEASDQEAYLGSILSGAESARPGGEAIPAAHPAATPAAPAAPSAPAGGSRLAKLKQLALAKQLEEEKQKSQETQEEKNARVSKAVERAYRFLKEFTEQLNIVKPAYAKEYSIVGVPNFDDLVWERGRIDFSTRETSPITRLYELVTLEFKLSSNKQLRVIRETPADENMKQLLLENNIAFTAQQERSERGSILRTSFILPCEVRASLQLIGKFDTGKLLLKTFNIGSFGMIEHALAPEAVTEESLDELTGFILGESSRIGPLLLKNA
jgi:hypothetical protein